MYADDGLILRKEETYVEELNNRKWGIKVSEDKPLGWTKKLKFLGIEYDLTEGTATFDKTTVNIQDTEAMEKLLEYAKYDNGQTETYRTTMIMIPNKYLNWRCKDDSIILSIHFNEHLRSRENWGSWNQ